MNAARDVEMEPYTTPQEWLEGKRRLVRMLRQLCADASGGARARREPPRCDREVLEAALNWYESRHSLRLSLTHAAGSRLPMDDFAEEMGLDSVEREVVELLLVAATDMTREDGRYVSSQEMVWLLARGEAEKAQDYLPYFLQGSRLLNAVLNRECLGPPRLHLDDDQVRRLLGMERDPREEAAENGKRESSWNGDIAEFLSKSGIALGEQTLDSIKTVWGYVLRRDLIRDKWGFGALPQVSGGLCLLFHGPSGTGKTLTARALCRALGREPLVVSYPELVSKWVGEMQKNTSAAFREAARAGKVLVFDEADAVFARRTEVVTSTDRHANNEVNTLLMELERFPGVVILTTNHAGDFDTALERRIKHKVYFGVPDAPVRAEIWRKHLPREAPLAPDVDLDRLGERFKLTGGQIANATLTAASLAAARLDNDEQNGQITMADFEAAAERERKGYVECEGDGRLGF